MSKSMDEPLCPPGIAETECPQFSAETSQHSAEAVNITASRPIRAVGSCGDLLRAYTPGVIGELMLVNTDIFKELEITTNFDHPIQAKTLDGYGSKLSVDLQLQQQHEPELSVRFAEIATEENEEADLKEEEEEDFLSNSDWLTKEKHVFILSESGKPIYTRHGKEDRLVTLFGLMQALVSVVADSDDAIRSVVAGEHTFVFLTRSPLILVAVSKCGASVPQLTMQLSYIHSQIVSVLTASVLSRMFERRRNYDFRHMLGGTERLIDSLIGLLDSHPSFLLGAVQCLPLSGTLRETITQTVIRHCAKIKNLVFGLIICKDQLISLVRMKNFLLHPADLHLLFNLVSATASLKTSENWIPICLPKFDPNGYLYGHVSYLSEDCEACLILLSVDKEQFFLLSEAKKNIVDRLRRHHCLEGINISLRTPSYSPRTIGCADLRHFLYKSKTTAQYTVPSYVPPYHTEEERKHLFCCYQRIHHRIHSAARPLRMLYIVTDRETLVGWVTKEFELYAALEPLVTKAQAIVCVNKLLDWIKGEEGRLFILSSPTF